MRILIPLQSDVPLPWDHYLLQAALGSPRVPNWLLASVPPLVASHEGIKEEEVEGEHIERVLANLPEDPRPFLRKLFDFLHEDLPSPTHTLRLPEDLGYGSGREGVSQIDLVHDASIIFQLNYGSEGFFEFFEATEDLDSWDARGAVGAMLYVLLLWSTGSTPEVIGFSPK